MDSKRKEYPHIKCTNHAILITDKEKSTIFDKYLIRNIIIDEISLLDMNQINKTKQLYPLATLIFCGDPAQLDTFEKTKSS